MFNTITWQQFLLAALLIVGVYYVTATLLLFRKEISAWFKPKPIPIEPDKDDPLTTTDNALMGKAAEEEDLFSRRSSIVHSEELVVSRVSTDEMPDTIQTPGEVQLLTGTIADLMQEISVLLQMAEEHQSTKEECSQLFISLFERYPNLKDTAYAHTVNRHICEEGKSKFSFDVEMLEVRSWWESGAQK